MQWSQTTISPTGLITFKDGGATIGFDTFWSRSVAYWRFSDLAPGYHRITAVYSGDALYAPATSASIDVMIYDTTTRGDANCDARGDILWQKTSPNPVPMPMVWWTMDGSSVKAVAVPGFSYDESKPGEPTHPIGLFPIAGIGDFDGNGRADAVWLDAYNVPWISRMWGDPDKMTAYSYPPLRDATGQHPQPLPSGFRLEGIGDLDGNGKDDIIIRGSLYGEILVWPDADSTRAFSLGGVVTSYKIAAVADLDANGRADIVWRGQNDGAVVIWLTNYAGNGVDSVKFITNVDIRYNIVSAVDLTRDRKAEVIWRGIDDGNVVVWVMDGSSVIDVKVLANVDKTYAIEALPDINGDGIPDIIWRGQNDGNVVAWTMGSNLTIQHSALIGAMDPAVYHIIGPR